MGKRHKHTYHQRRYANEKYAHEKMFTSIPIREMKIKTTMSYHYTPVRMAKIKNSDHTNILCS